jgi:hypothetical protein
VATGLVAHAVWMIVFGVIFAAMAKRRTTAMVVIVAITVSAAAVLASRSAIPPAMGAVRYASLSGAGVLLCLAMMTGGLVIGRAIAGTD